METLRLSHVYKTYKGKKRKDPDVTAVQDFNLTVEDNEFVVFVGPSGCGKSTTLRMIAGLEEVTSGDIYLDGVRVNDLESNRRDIAMVFQNYALYPHMTAYQNMAFGLKNRHVPKEEIDQRIHNVAKILSIEELLQRKPKDMSGGQRQRVALGRAIIRTPKVFLLDEPLSNLDAKLRASMRVEISRLYEKLQTTFIYVTHDQIEAMTMGTRIVVMRKGVVQQIDTPTNLFDYPANRFVAGFLGTPQMNFYEGEMVSSEKGVSLSFHGLSFDLPWSKLREMNPEYKKEGTHKVILGIRPDDVSFDEKGPFPVRLGISENLGNETLYYGNLNLEEEGELRDSPTSLVIRGDRKDKMKRGVVNVSFAPNKLHLFEDKEGEKSILLTPRPHIDRLRAYLSVEEGQSYLYLNPSLKFALPELDPSTLNPVYLEGMHRVDMELKEGAVSLGEGNLNGRIKGCGMLNDGYYARVDLSLDPTPFEDDSTCLYVPIEKECPENKEVRVALHFEHIDIYGEDHKLVTDLSPKEKALDVYGLKDDTK